MFTISISHRESFSLVAEKNWHRKNSNWHSSSLGHKFAGHHEYFVCRCDRSGFAGRQCKWRSNFTAIAISTWSCVVQLRVEAWAHCGASHAFSTVSSVSCWLFSCQPIRNQLWRYSLLWVLLVIWVMNYNIYKYDNIPSSMAHHQIVELCWCLIGTTLGPFSLSES